LGTLRCTCTLAYLRCTDPKGSLFLNQSNYDLCGIPTPAAQERQHLLHVQQVLPALRYADMHDVLRILGNLWSFMNYLVQITLAQDGSAR